MAKKPLEQMRDITASLPFGLLNWQVAIRASWLRTIYATLGQQAIHLPDWLECWDPAQVNRALHLLIHEIVVTPALDNHLVKILYKGD